MLTALVVGAFGAPPALAGDGTFPTEPAGSPFGAGTSPRSVAVGDFDSDGNEDMAVANQGGGVTVRLGAGDGTFPTQPTGSPFGTGTQPFSVAIGDFDSDGNEDLAVANVSGDDVTVRLGAGDGTFPTQPAGSPFGAGDNPLSVAIGDFDSDGNDDMAVATLDGVTVRLGAGDGTFPTQPAGSPFAAGDNPVSVAVGDFDSDGNEDLAVANFGGGVTVRLGAGDGTFATEPAGSPFGAGNHPFSVAIADFDSDGNDDMAVATLDGVTVRLGAGDGTFATEPAGSPFGAGGNPFSVAIGDFDSDGNEDLAVANLGGGVTVRLGAGAPPLQGNLLNRGGVEGSGAARKTSQFPALPGLWDRSGQMTYLRYGVAGGFPNHIDSPRFLTGGLNMFWGGPAAADSTATQTVSVASSAASIDAGLATADLSAYLGGFKGENDRMTATATFGDANGDPLGSVAVGPVTAADRDDRTVLLPRSTAGAVPAGTRQIEVRLDATYSAGPLNNALADNVKLTLDAPTPPPTCEDVAAATGSGQPDDIALDCSGEGALTFSIVAGPSEGAISNLNPTTGTLTYTPDAGFSGTDAFTYKATNAGGDSNISTVTIDVDPPPPTCDNVSASTGHNQSRGITLDCSGAGTLTHAIVTGPSHGDVSGFNPAAGTLTYTPDQGFSGADSLAYRATNAGGDSNTATVTLAVAPSPPTPKPAAPKNSARPETSGKKRQGKRRTCTPGAWSGNPSFAFAWERNGNPIAGATATTYKLKRKDVGRAIQCQVTATNAGGSASADSKPVVPKKKKKKHRRR